MIVAGFGFRSSATADSFQNALRDMRDHITAIATLAEKADHPAFVTFATQMHLPIHKISQQEMQAQSTVTQSSVSLSAKGTGSVAEATALAAAGPGAILTQARIISTDGRATCAIATGGAE